MLCLHFKFCIRYFLHNNIVQTFIRGRIAVIGGYDGTSLLDTVEVYDSDKDEWTIESQMLTPRCDSGFACVAYRQ
ncbi:unnamed protein product [Rotaria sp. Silwood1]|nr:unnamed protein product [Rotaria sp. Silwood1]